MISEPLTAEEVDKIWRHYKETDNVDSRNKLVEHYLPSVRYTSERLKAKLPSYIDINDLYNIGVLGLIDAVDKFDIERGVKFETYCGLRIRGEIIDSIRRMDWVPRNLRSKTTGVERAHSELEKELGRPPGNHELAEKLGLSEEELEDVLREVNVRQMLSLDGKWTIDKDGEMTRLEIAESMDKTDPSIALNRQELRESIISGLNEQEQMILIMYYYDELTMKEIGEVLSVTESRICQVHSQLITRLRSKLGPWHGEA